MSSWSSLLLKIALSPLLVGAASLLMAKVGPRRGGLLTALPVVTGPVLLLFALERGSHFAAEAAAKTLVGTVALLAYTTTYVALARSLGRPWPGIWHFADGAIGTAPIAAVTRASAESSSPRTRLRTRARAADGTTPLSPWLCLVSGWAVFIVAAAALLRVPWPRFAGLFLALSAVTLGIASLAGESSESDAQRVAHPALRLLVLRVVAAGLLVCALSYAAPRLGPSWSGILTAFPVVSTVMLVATHRDHGLKVAIGWLRGFYLGLFGYVSFVSIIAYGLEPLGMAPAFCLGIACAVSIQSLVNWATQVPRSRSPRVP